MRVPVANDVITSAADGGDEPPPLNLSERRTAAFAIAALALSAILGLCAYGYLPRLITAVTFSLNDSIAYLVLLQEVTCGIGMIAIGYFCYLRIFAP